MNFVFMTDPHLMLRIPTGRTDDYPTTILDKVAWTVDYANSIDATLLLGGDLLDAYNSHPELVNVLASILSRANRQIFSIIGNHDVYGQTSTTINRVILGTLFSTGLLKLLTLDPIILDDGEVKIQLTGGNYTNGMESHPEMYNVQKLPEVDKAIHLVHGFLIRKHWPSLNRNYTLITSLMTQADVTCAGHEHSGFGIEEFDNRFFLNPGALGRISATETEIQRTPRVGVITMTKTSTVVSLKDVDIALPGESVLSREKIVEEQRRKEVLTEIQSQIEETDFTTVSTIEEIFEEQSQLLKIPKEVYDFSKAAFEEYCRTTG